MAELREMADALWLTDKLHWDLALYWLFLLNLVMLLMLPDGATTQTFFSIIVLVSLVIDKVYAFGYVIDTGPYTPQVCHAEIFIGTYLIRAIIFAAPLAIAGLTDEPRVRTVGVVAGISGAVYIFVRWYLEQRDVEAPDVVCLNTDVMWQSAGAALLLARIALGRRLRLDAVHRHIPVAVLGELAAHEVEV
jgi:hypothetical protein